MRRKKTMNWFIFFILSCFIFCEGESWAEAGGFFDTLQKNLEKNLVINGRIKNETAIRLQDGPDNSFFGWAPARYMIFSNPGKYPAREGEERGEFTKIENRFDLKVRYNISSNAYLYWICRTVYDAVYEAENLEKPRIQNKNREFDFSPLRELYLDFTIGKFYARLGRQQVVWGKTDGIKMLDVVCPMSLEEGLLDDFEDSRIPLWMFNLNYKFTPEYNLQLLWILEFKHNYIPAYGQEFFPYMGQFERTPLIDVYNLYRAYDLLPPFLQPLVHRPTLTALRSEEPEPFHNIHKESIFGFRFEGLWKGFFFALNYLHTYDMFPTIYSNVAIAPNPFDPGLPPNIDVTLTTKYPRLDIFGIAFDKDVWFNTILRGEMAYYKGDTFPTTDPKDSDGVKRSDQLQYALGLDHFFFRDYFTSFQLIQMIIPNNFDRSRKLCDDMYGSRLAPLDRVRTYLTLLCKADFMHESLYPEILLIYGANNGEWNIRPKVLYKVTDNFFARWGFDIFSGEYNDPFGQFNRKDRVFFELEYNF